MISRTICFSLLACSLAVSACGDEDDDANVSDAGGSDAGGSDGGAPDTGSPDAGQGDGGAAGDAGGGADCLRSDNTCWSGQGVAETCKGNGKLPTTCSEQNVQGTCAFESSGQNVTVRYYRGSNGQAWTDLSGRTAQDECSLLYKGTYTAR